MARNGSPETQSSPDPCISTAAKTASPAALHSFAKFLVGIWDGYTFPPPIGVFFLPSGPDWLKKYTAKLTEGVFTFRAHQIYREITPFAVKLCIYTVFIHKSRHSGVILWSSQLVRGRRRWVLTGIDTYRKILDEALAARAQLYGQGEVRGPARRGRRTRSSVEIASSWAPALAGQRIPWARRPPPGAAPGGRQAPEATERCGFRAREGTSRSWRLSLSLHFPLCRIIEYIVFIPGVS